MQFRKGVNRLVVVLIVIWEALLVLLLSFDRSSGDLPILLGAMVGGPVIAILLTRALFWIIEGFR